jgi:hypothetical protein
MRRKRPGFHHVDATETAFLEEAGMDALLQADPVLSRRRNRLPAFDQPPQERMFHFADPSQLSDVRIEDQQLAAEKNRRPRSIGYRGDQPLQPSTIHAVQSATDVEPFERKETVDDASTRGRPMDLSGCSLLR